MMYYMYESFVPHAQRATYKKNSVKFPLWYNIVSIMISYISQNKQTNEIEKKQEKQSVKHMHI